MLWHDDFFTLPTGEKDSIVELGHYSGHFPIIHPYFHFGSSVWELTREREIIHQIYSEQYQLDNINHDFSICNFMANVESNYHLNSDSVLWYETGFWTIVRDSTCFMGMGISKFEDVLKKKAEKFSLCLSNNVSTMILTSEKNDQSKLLLNIFVSNEFIPFVEVIDPFKKEISSYKNSVRVSSRVILEEDLRRFWIGNRSIIVNPVAAAMHSEQRDLKTLPVIKNPFTRVKDPVISNLSQIVGVTGGGFIEEDFGKRKFMLGATIWELSNTSVIEFVFDRTELDDDTL